MTISEAKSKAAKMYTSTKGRRVYRLKKKYMEGFLDENLEDQVDNVKTIYQHYKYERLRFQS